MARPSKLTEKQWAEIERRMLDGEAGCALGKEYGVSYNAIKKRFGSQVNQIKTVAAQIITTERAFGELSISSQIKTVNLAAKLRSISEHAAGAAEFGMMTAHRLSILANSEVQKIDDVNPLQSMEQLKGVAALTDLANKASTIGLNLLAANKDMAKGAIAEKDITPESIPDDPVEASRAYQRLING